MSSQSSSNSSNCDFIGTRAEVLVLRNAGELEPGCQYVITNYSRGCLGAVPEIVLTAASTTRFAHDVDLLSSYDTDYWRGKYDIDTNRVYSLEDNRGNKVYGITGAEVDAFPWGSTQWAEVVVDNATVLTDCAPAINVSNCRFTSDSFTDLRGTTGTMYNSTIEDASILELDDAAVTIRSLTMSSRARILGERSTNVQIYYHEQTSEGYWIFRDRDDVRSYYSSIHSSSRVYYTGGTRQWLYYTNINSYAHIRQFSGNLRLYYSKLDSYAELRNEAGSGDFDGYGVSYSSRAYIRNYNTNRVRTYFPEVTSRGEVNYRDGADVRDFYNTISSFGRLLISGTTTIVYAVNINAQSIFTVTAGTHYRNQLTAYSRITTAFNTRSVYAVGAFAQTLTAANSNRSRDHHNNTLV